MGRLFCYTLSARAIGATVSAGALHAQGWGFESLIAHHMIDKAPSNGSLSFSGPSHEIRTRQGAELRKREAFSSAAREGRRPEAEAGGASRTRHPSSPTTDLETVLARGPFLFGPSAWDSNPPGCGAEETRSVFQRSTRGPEARSGSGRRNASLANAPVQKMPNMSTATILVAGFSRPQRTNRTFKRRLTVQMGSISDCKTGHMWFN